MLGLISKGNNMYAAYQIAPGQEIDAVSVAMINSNIEKKTSFAPISLETFNGVYSGVLFDITGKKTVRDFISGNMTQFMFRKLMEGLVNAIDSTEEYMIDITQVLLQPDTVFINEFDYSVSLICLPIKNIEIQSSLYGFFADVVKSSRVTVLPNEHSYFNSVYNVIATEGSFSLANIRIAIQMDEQPGGVGGNNAAGGNIASGQPGVKTVQAAQEHERVYPQKPFVPEPVQEEAPKGFFGKLMGKSSKKEKEPAVGLAGLKNGNKGKAFPGNGAAAPNGNGPVVQGQPGGNMGPAGVNAGPVNSRPVGGNMGYAGGNAMPGGNMAPGNMNPGNGMPYGANAGQPGGNVGRPGNNGVIIGGSVNLQGGNGAPVSGGSKPGWNQVNPDRGGNSISFVGDNGPGRFWLTRVKNNERILINKPRFVIGREENCDYCTGQENPSVSRTHATILMDANGCRIMDNNSANHTIVEGVRVMPGTEIALKDGVRIRIANEEFIFTEITV